MTRMDDDSVASRWTPSSPEGRWCGFGPYYAMFPVEFARRTVEQLCPAQGRLLDPFCGRGTSLFVASVTGRTALGADTNPVAWLFSKVKLDPWARHEAILARVCDVAANIKPADRRAKNEFQAWAWHRDVLGFLNVARRTLNWRRNKLDRTLMALILVHLHAKCGEGLSNQMRQSKAMAPEYSVRWWKRRNLRPPPIDVVTFFANKLAWRYRLGIPHHIGSARVFLGDSRDVLSRESSFDADLILTSPPYAGVTNYAYDNWIRLWMLGSSALPQHSQATRYSNPDKYASLLDGVFSEARRLSKPSAKVYVRTHSLFSTLDLTLEVLQDIWPKHTLYYRYDGAPWRAQTRLFQKHWNKLNEVDLLLIARNDRRFKKSSSFRLVAGTPQ